MGLDMYLERCDRYSEDEFIFKEVVYWRKAYPIMDWFENKLGDNDRLDNCARYNLTINHLKELYEFVNKNISTELGCMDEIICNWYTGDKEWGMEDLRYTQKKLEEIIKEYEDNEFNTSFYMFHAWW